ncbi:MAG: NADH-quinone oxidoreductase subunit J [Chitinivibrionales bacterium]|nr:NADH-quinone oxidoreductase subunit J [Chitinivibrionales bacterium]
MILREIFFFLFGGTAVLCGLFMLTRKSALSGAVSLVVCFLSFAGLYAMLDAPFIAAMQVLVYAGAIMMLIIFVIMTIDLSAEERRAEKPVIVGGIIAGAIVAAAIALYSITVRGLPHITGAARIDGSVTHIGAVMFSKHVLNFEMLSLLLLVALVGAVVLGKKKAKEG